MSGELGGPKRAVGDTKAMVADLLGQGMTPRAIAERLGITAQAVYKHMASIRADREGASA